MSFIAIGIPPEYIVIRKKIYIYHRRTIEQIQILKLQKLITNTRVLNILKIT